MLTNNAIRQSKINPGIHAGYRDIVYNKESSVLYYDPHYEGTAKYKKDFNHKELWNWVREKVSTEYISMNVNDA